MSGSCQRLGAQTGRGLEAVAPSAGESQAAGELDFSCRTCAESFI